MLIRQDGERNRWNLCRNKDTNKIELRYEELCRATGEWIKISAIIFSAEIDGQTDFD